MYNYIDLNKKWDNYGKSIDISNLNKEDYYNSAKLFSEGLKELEDLLIILWNKRYKTKACCRGFHFSVNDKNKPKISSGSYIMFDKDLDWKNYLSEKIINDDYVFITNYSIQYYGDNNIEFFKELIRCFSGNKIKNNEILNNKKNNISLIDARVNALTRTLINYGFLDDQINKLSSLYKSQLMLQIEVRKEFNDDIYKKYQDELNKYENLLIECIKENNKNLG